MIDPLAQKAHAQSGQSERLALKFDLRSELQQLESVTVKHISALELKRRAKGAKK